jgi:hypothetical protein
MNKPRACSLCWWAWDKLANKKPQHLRVKSRVAWLPNTQTQKPLKMAVLLACFTSVAIAQNPSTSWKPNFEPLGLFCYKDAKLPNYPDSHDHIGGCGCENTQFRWTDGSMYMLESHSHGCETIFANYNTTRDGDCSFFRIREMESGRVIANISASIGHSFFSAVVDYNAKPSPKLWVFGPAHARGNKVNPGPCDGNGNWKGCYIGSWSSTDLINWSKTSKAVPIPDHHAAFNTRTTMVTNMSVEAKKALPPHQAAMVLEPRGDHAFANTTFRYAINTGTDGDLSKNWQLLLASKFSESGWPSGPGEWSPSAVGVVSILDPHTV